MKTKKTKTAREWWTHYDGTDGEGLYECDMRQHEECADCDDDQPRIRVREVLRPARKVKK